MSLLETCAIPIRHLSGVVEMCSLRVCLQIELGLSTYNQQCAYLVIALNGAACQIFSEISGGRELDKPTLCSPHVCSHMC